MHSGYDKKMLGPSILGFTPNFGFPQHRMLQNLEPQTLSKRSEISACSKNENQGSTFWPKPWTLTQGMVEFDVSGPKP